MMRSERLVVRGERGFAERECFCCIAIGQKQGREIGTHAICVRMLMAERLLVDRQRALVQWPRRRKVALGLKQEGEVVEARRRIAMLEPRASSRIASARS